MKFAKLMMAAAIAAGTMFVIIGCGESEQSSRESDKKLRLGSIANLKQIGTACKMYSMNFQEHYPVNLSGLVTQCYLDDPKVFVSPLDKKRTPADFSKFPNYDTHRAQDIYSFSFPEANLSYVYLGAGLKETSDPDCPIAFEKPDLIQDGHLNILYVDGHVSSWLINNKKPRTCVEILNELPFVGAEKAILLKNAEEIDKKAK